MIYIYIKKFGITIIIFYLLIYLLKFIIIKNYKNKIKIELKWQKKMIENKKIKKIFNTYKNQN